MFQLFAHVTRKIRASPSTNRSKVIKTRHSSRKFIPAAKCLALTLLFLAPGDSRLSFAFRICTTTVSNIIKETCIVLKEVLTDKFVKPPRCETDCLEMAKDFEEIWNLPNVVGAFDRKHIQIEVPQTVEHSSITIKNFLVYFSLLFLIPTTVLLW